MAVGQPKYDQRRAWVALRHMFHVNPRDGLRLPLVQDSTIQLTSGRHQFFAGKVSMPPFGNQERSKTWCHKFCLDIIMKYHTVVNVAFILLTVILGLDACQYAILGWS